MKSWKKLISLALVLVMALSLSLTAFAAPNSGVATIVVNNGETTTVKTITLTDGMTLYTALNNSFASMNPDWTDVEDYYTPGVYHKALRSLTGKSSMPIGAASGIEAEAWSTVNPGYGLMSVNKDESGTITGYNYVYVGKDWTYKNEDGDIWVYMDQYVLQPGDIITITYSQQISYWTAPTPQLPAYPYI